ncbi:winged helix-turn-helix domain-containing protein [Hoylesella pleuritidis]|jgi:hypothetical protein|uniref:PF10771 family protein n=1 Tax=Hoylesella pleuritidis F0068 TaxID=1081904 RepID=U2MF05_9BACT|nr:winged helix-turn-helix domain-containing protein [Hoylesella pleuritidis]ERK00245.1 PF10771 family protein [Hoylesella pleuritidis F0068]
MAEKKATTKKAVATKTETTKKTVTKKTSEKKVEVLINAESVGFRAGDVYQALATAAKALTVAEIAKAAKITVEEVLLGMGWLFKEGKIKNEASKIVLA